MAEEKNNAKIDNQKQSKLKNQAERASQEEALKQTSPEELRGMLTNKNADYVFRLQKVLEHQGKMTADAAYAKVADLLPEIVAAQRRGQPANSFYMASPKIKAQEILHPHVAPKATAFWQKAVDNILLMFVIFAAFYGVMGVFNTKYQTNQNGITVVVVISALVGALMTKYNDWVLPAKGQTKPSFWKMILISAAFIAILMVAIMVLTLPALSVINPVLPGIVYIILAVIAYGGRYWFRKQYHIVGSSFAGTSTIQDSENK